MKNFYLAKKKSTNIKRLNLIKFTQSDIECDFYLTQFLFYSYFEFFIELNIEAIEVGICTEA